MCGAHDDLYLLPKRSSRSTERSPLHIVRMSIRDRLRHRNVRQARALSTALRGVLIRERVNGVVCTTKQAALVAVRKMVHVFVTRVHRAL